MSVLPRSKKEIIEWFEARIADFGDHALEVGLTTQQAADLAVAVSVARQALDDNELKYVAARSSTTAYHEAVDVLEDLGAQYIKIVRAFAFTQQNPRTVLSLVGIPVPATPSEQGAPPIAELVRAVLTGSGSIQVTWKAPSGGFGSGAFFIVERKLSESTPWERIGTTAGRRFVDDNVPTGFGSISYRLISARGTNYSFASDPTVVFAGTTGGNASAAPEGSSSNESEGETPAAEAA